MEEKKSKFELLVPILPKFLTTLVLGGALLYLMPSIAGAIKNEQGVELSFGDATIKIVEEKLETAQFISGEDRDSISPEAFAMQFTSLAARIEADPEALKGAAVLWVDDLNPTRNIYEREALQELDVRVDMAQTTGEAVELIEGGRVRYDAMVLDLDRPGQAVASCENSFSNAGCDLLIKAARICGDRLPAIVYAAGIDRSKGTPPYAAGMTNRVDKLIGLLLDAFAKRTRVQGGDPTMQEPEAACRGNPINLAS